jgi:Ser/Thr protein kinase RdoA (MazF antagonist)
VAGTNLRPFQELTPDRIMDAVESTGLRCDGRLMALNSFENRVYQIGIEDGAPVVAKFYRPRRWSDAAIGEEHTFCAELEVAEIPVVAPLDLGGGRTLAMAHGFRFALFPKRPGRAPELDDDATLEWLGRFIARIHVIGARARFAHRPSVSVESYGASPLAFLLKRNFIAEELRQAYASTAAHALERVRARYADAGAIGELRLHADCHAGNILWTPDGPHFVDLDDCRTGPAIQDLWMLLSGDRASMTRQLAAVIEGYRTFADFDARELWLIEPLRTLRMIQHSAWLAERWNDPAFPAAFPWFGTQRYWQDQILALKEQIAAMDESPLHLD